MSVRFMPDGRLKTESGSMLDGGPRLDSEDAAVAVRAAQRVLLHRYPETEDVTPDRSRVASLIAMVSTEPVLEGHSARVYRRGEERILVIEHHH